MGKALQRLGPFRNLPDVIAQLGFDPDALLREANLSADTLHEQGATSQSSMVNRLLNFCSERTGCEHFGLLVAKSFGLADLAEVGQLCASSPDVATALRNLVAGFKFHNGAAFLWLERDTEFAALHYCLYEPREDPAAQLHAGTALSICNVLTELCGPAWSALEVHLPFRRPADSQPYRTLLRAPLVFDADSVAVRFDHRWLERAVRTADPQQYARLEGLLRRTDSFGDADFPTIVRRVIRRQLLVGKCDADDVAEALAMHRRTLDRRLAGAGTSFQQLLDAVRYDVARQLLRETGLSVQRISVHLHYGSVGNFSTAFRRWSGATPRAYRANSSRRPGTIATPDLLMPSAMAIGTSSFR